MIALHGVSKTYPTVNGRRVMLDNASAVFESGCNFRGVNGAGKIGADPACSPARLFGDFSQVVAGPRDFRLYRPHRWRQRVTFAYGTGSIVRAIRAKGASLCAIEP